MITINDACDYTIVKLCEGGVPLSHLKLQKVLYYAQAWHLAFTNGERLFDGKFQAWIHGPVSREIYDRFAGKSLYADITRADARPDFDPEALDLAAREHLGSIFEGYAKFSGTQLEELTHREDPWINARVGYRPSERCEVEIDENLMTAYYRHQMECAAV